MRANKNLDLLARQDWESRMRDVFKEAAPRFKALKKNIVDYHKTTEKARKVAEREARKAAAAVARAARARGRGQARGTRGGRRGGTRGMRGRGGAARGGIGADDSDSESLDMTSAWKSSLGTAKRPGLDWTQTGQDRKFPRPSKTVTAVQSSVSQDFGNLKTDERLVLTG